VTPHVPADDESALVVVVPEAEPLVADLRAQYDRSAARGMPAHVTVLYPFRHPDALDAPVLGALSDTFARQAAFRYALVGVCGFPGVVYLAPQPRDPFDALTRAVAARFPDTPPYAGAIADPIPHLTVAQSPPAAALDEISGQLLASLGATLPLACEARAVTLATKRAGRWTLGRRFGLGL
jgi:hypothetical protein